MAKQTGQAASEGRRKFTAEFKKEAVQMMLDGHSPASIVKNLGCTLSLESGGTES